MSNDFVWWKHGVIYQIYPRSFRDSNGDGIGDLAGITAKLDYLAELGVDGLWLSPFFESPGYDFGYDISDYRAVDSVFGDLADVDRLVAEAHARGIRIILDLVMNHTSHLHPWFRDSSHAKSSPRRDWYIWHPGRRFFGLRRPPNNWMAAFGGRAWSWDRRSREYYLHLFLPEQPDLNWRNPAVEEAMFGEIRFWLERGVDGFRLDVVNYIVKDEAFRSNPYRLHAAYPRRHDQQLHLYDRNRPETHAILRRFRALLDEYGETMSVGEIYPNEGVREPEVAATYLGRKSDELHLAFDFSPVFAPFSASAFRGILERWYAAVENHGWPCHVLSNHDKSRAFTRLCRGSLSRAKLLAALLLTQRGTPFLYYGEEIGMRDGRLSRSDLADPLGRKYWPLHPGRDPERTPMQWNDGSLAGFSEGVASWLPVNGDYREKNVARQRRDPASLLNWYKRLIGLRRESETLRTGTIEFIDAGRTVLAYRRRTATATVLVLLNFASRPRRLVLPAGGRTMLGTHPDSSANRLEAYEVRIIEEK